MPGIILLVDNKEDVHQKLGRLLESEGYELLHAGSVQEADELLTTRRLHLAVIDVRLADDDDSNDTSGLDLAKRQEYYAVPKIILTAYPDPSDVRAMLLKDNAEQSPAVDFVFKAEGAGAILDALEKAFTSHVGINWKLRLRANPREPVSLQHLVLLMTPDLEPALTKEQAEELGDVLRKLFYDAEQVTLERLLWCRGGRAAVLAVVFLLGDMQRLVVVECGVRAAMADEAARCETLGRDQPNQGLIQTAIVETMHFAGRTYTAAMGNLEGLLAIRDYYGKQPAKEVGATLEKLFTVSLASWHAEPRLAQATESIAGLYRAKLGLEGSTLAAEIALRIESLDRQARALGLGGLASGADGLWVQFLKASGGSFAHPATCLCDDALTGASVSVQVGTTVGALDADSVLMDAGGSVWPSDFGSLGSGPLLGDYTALETSVKFDLLETTDLSELYALEQTLTAPSWLNDRLEPEALPEDLAKAFVVIRRIRQLAANACGVDIRPYYLGLLFYTAKRLLAVEPDVHLSKQELVPPVHACMLLGMLCDRLTYLGYGRSLPSIGGVLAIDEAAREVWIGGQKVDLSQGEYDLLFYLWKHPREVCTRATLYQVIYGEKYGGEVDDPSLNMVVTRLRRKIEADPENPQIVVTKRGIGYMLDLHKA